MADREVAADDGEGLPRPEIARLLGRKIGDGERAPIDREIRQVGERHPRSKRFQGLVGALVVALGLDVDQLDILLRGLGVETLIISGAWIPAGISRRILAHWSRATKA